MDMIYNVSEKIPNPLQMDPDTQNLLTELSNILSTNVAGSRWCDELPVAPMRPGWGVSPIQKPPVKAFNPTQPEISMLRFIRNIWAHKQRNIQAGLWRDEDEMSKVFSTAFHGFV